MERFIELDTGRYHAVRAFAERSEGEREYYHAILDGRQRGRVFADDAARTAMALFWHYAGFGFAAGAPDGEFLENVLSMVRQTHPYYTQDTALHRRFVLQQDDPSGRGMLENAAGVLRSERLCYALTNARRRTTALPDGYTLRSADAALLPLLKGSVTPAFSWSSDAEFLRGGGMARVVMHGAEPAAWAFSAALGGGRMDIGVETAEPYRGKGLACAAAAAMAEAALSTGYTPVWGCDAANVASAHTAERAGFALYCRHAKYKKGE